MFAALTSAIVTARALSGQKAAQKHDRQATAEPAAADRDGRDPSCRHVSAKACTAARQLGRGINFGNMLEAPLEAGYGLWLQYAWIKAARDAGFQHMRLPVRWSNHASRDAAATLDPEFLKRVDGILSEAQKLGMPVVLDMHHYRQLDGDPVEGNEVAVDAEVVDQRAVNIWRQLARHYSNRFANVHFELYNEAHGRLDAERWNALHARLLAAVRSEDKSRLVILGPVEWNNPDALAALRFPDDRDVIATAHVYAPYPFTHQGAWGSQWKTTIRCCDDGQKKAIRAAFDRMVAWSTANGVPVYVGEWGSHVSAPQESRLAYARTVRAELDRANLPWAYWQLSSDFGIYDVKTGQWETDLVAVLTGQRIAASGAAPTIPVTPASASTDTQSRK